MTTDPFSARALCAKPPTAETLAGALALVRRGDGPALFHEIVALSDSSPLEKRTPLGAALARIEAIVSLSPELGMYLLAKLYPLAAKHEHEVHDAIELWMHDARSAQAARGLELAGGESRPLFAKQFKTLAAEILARSKSASSGQK